MINFNWANYEGPIGESFTLPSKTVPDMSVSLRQMLDRHNSGGAIKTFHTANVPLEGSLIPDNFERMSAIDRAVLSQDVSDFVASTRGRLITAREAAKRAEYDARFSAAVAAAAALRGSSSSDE